jgi:hypothetical protein
MRMGPTRGGVGWSRSYQDGRGRRMDVRVHAGPNRGQHSTRDLLGRMVGDKRAIQFSGHGMRIPQFR